MTVPLADDAVVLGELVSDHAAVVLARRLVAERIGAEAVGPLVWVRAADRERAVVLARLYHEVDTGRSRVAPVPGTWASTRSGVVVRALAVALVVIPALSALVIAIGL